MKSKAVITEKKAEQVYKVLKAMRYAWKPKNGRWIWRPRTMQSTRRLFRVAREFEKFVEEE